MIEEARSLAPPGLYHYSCHGRNRSYGYSIRIEATTPLDFVLYSLLSIFISANPAEYMACLLLLNK